MDPYQSRRWVIILIILFIGVIFLSRLFYIQVIDSKWIDRAQSITHSRKIIKPSRGLIYDRNGELLVIAKQVYDIWTTPKDIGEVDTLELCEVLGITKADFDKRLKKARNYAPYKASVFIEGISQEDYGSIITKLKHYKGFETKKNTQRGYPHDIAAHILGYIRKISAEQYAKDKLKEEPYYLMDDYIGITGLERTYEKELRGKRGALEYLRDRLGNEATELSTNYAQEGKKIYSSIDLNLQEYGEQLMNNKIGCIVAIEPSTGEILSMVSAPTYSPTGLVGRDFAKTWSALSKNDSLKPLLNRSVYNSNYRPGSIFKLVQALVAMEEGVISESTGFPCNKSLIGCHNHESPSNIRTAIKHSCNPYFYQVYKKLILRGESSSVFIDSRIGLTKWREAVASFGLGVKFNSDIPGVKKGNIPDTAFYDKWYGKNRWAFSTIYSNSIGEGEIGVSPLQMANLAAILANKGYYYTPHLVKKIGEDGDKKPLFKEKHYTMVDSSYFTPVREAMEQVVLSGTARRAQVDSVAVCGKTGTVENKNFNDHSVFIAFAPKDDPKIAIAVYVEYGTWGGTWAAPIASVMIEKYLKGVLSEKGKRKEEKILEAVILDKHSNFKR
jgi:penicillin-binding protein 2